MDNLTFFPVRKRYATIGVLKENTTEQVPLLEHSVVSLSGFEGPFRFFHHGEPMSTARY